MLGNGSRTQRFCVNVLSWRQQDVAEAFADPTHTNRFDFGQWSSGEDGLPVLERALASFECSVDLLYAYPQQVVVIGPVHSVVRTPNSAGPLTRSTDQFGQFIPADTVLPHAL